MPTTSDRDPYIRLNPAEKRLIFNFDEPGQNLFLYLFSNDPNFRWEFWIDEKLLIITGTYLSSESEHESGFNTSTDYIQVLEHNAGGGDNTMIVTLPFKWDLNFKLYARNAAGVVRTGMASIVWDKKLGVIEPEIKPDIQEPGKIDPLM